MDPETLLERATAAEEAGRVGRAIQLIDVALNQRPAPALAAALHLARAEAIARGGDWARAARDCRRALERAPIARAHALLARCLLEVADAAGAVREIEAALADAGAADWRVYARALSSVGRHDDALAAAERVRAAEPGVAALKLAVDVLARAGRHARVIALIEHAVPADARDGDLWTSLGLSAHALGRSAEAVAALRRALLCEPSRADASCALGMALLRIGEHAEGFRYNEHRQPAAGARWRFGVPPWRGERLDRAHLLVLSEQGLGDTIQFARFVPHVRRLAARVTFRVPASLARVLGAAPALADVVVADGHPGFASADFQALVMSLPHLLRGAQVVSGATLPAPLSLVPEPERVARWRARLPSGPTIALAWQGNPQFAGEPWRSIPFERLAPLIEARARDVTFVSLQKNFGREQLAGSPAGGRVLDLADDIDRDGHAFLDSLAILSLVDAFVTSDTALAHLAGSAGVRTLLLLSAVADWRWGEADERSAYYPSVRLFRQASAGDWDGVVRRAGAELEALLQSARHSGSKSIAACSIPPQVLSAGA